MGRGVIMPKSIKQKLNTKSSTESELVGASDYLAFTIYATLFLGMQGNKIENNIYIFRTTTVQFVLKIFNTQIHHCEIDIHHQFHIFIPIECDICFENFSSKLGPGLHEKQSNRDEYCSTGNDRPALGSFLNIQLDFALHGQVGHESVGAGFHF